MAFFVHYYSKNDDATYFEELPNSEAVATFIEDRMKHDGGLTVDKITVIEGWRRSLIAKEVAVRVEVSR